jgi:glycosyltransferase involved in cell wall biosynthesis
MKILIVSDAWEPQVNGVVRTLQATSRELKKMGHDVLVVGPDATRWCSIKTPTYPDITLELFARRRLRKIIERFQPDFIHIATEGPLGWAMRNLCLHLHRPFTSSFMTRFPEYFEARVPRWLTLSVKLFTYAGLRHFHAFSSAIMVATPSIEAILRKRRYRRIVRWSRGVDIAMFKPYDKNISTYSTFERPILLYVGRVAIEKNLRAFLNLKSPGTKVVIGQGPDLAILKNEYPSICFLGEMHNQQLAYHYSAADLFVFPSTTDTFGLVLLEACASGLRIASYPAPGPVDIFADPETCAFVVLDADLEQAVSRALALPDPGSLPHNFAERFSWEACTHQFFHNLQASTPQAIKRISRLRNWLGWRW